MMRDRFPDLAYFFGCYFHQDWDLEANTWQGVVQNFLNGEHPDYVKAATTQLGQLLSMNLDEKALEEALDELGNFRSPAPQTYGAWLNELHWLLRRGIRP
jgi:hypothetical protein